MSEAARPPRVWLAVSAISEHHGSEMLVGWQWYQRLRARGPVTALVTKLFDDPAFIGQATRADCRFIDTRAASGEDFTGHLLTHLVRWWRGCRAILKAEARPGDRLIIAVPGVIVLLPFVAGLPIRREHIVYGPIGADLAPRVARASALPSLRDVRTYAAAACWRLLRPALPRLLAFRTPSPRVRRLIGHGYTVLPDCPEVEVVAEPGSAAGHKVLVGVVYDARARKNFPATLDYAVELAAANAAVLAVIGLPDGERAHAAARAAERGVTLQVRPRLTRAEFKTWLGETCAMLVSLSRSEGVSSSLIEALQAGCELHVLTVGGMVWLEAAAAARREQPWRDTVVTIFRWDEGSAARFQALVAGRFAAIMDAVLPAAVVDHGARLVTGAPQQSPAQEHP